jgi:hypothetical protein
MVIKYGAALNGCNIYIQFKELVTKYLYKNWTYFIRILEIRNQIIHGITNVQLSNTRVFCFCEYTLSFLSAAIALCFMNDDMLCVLKSHKQITRKLQDIANSEVIIIQKCKQPFSR